MARTKKVKGIEKITTREREVIALFASGYTAKEIGGKLGISPNTVSNHRAKIMGKLGVKNAAEMIRVAIRGGIVKA